MLLSQVIEKWRKKSWVQIPHLTSKNLSKKTPQKVAKSKFYRKITAKNNHINRGVLEDG